MPSPHRDSELAATPTAATRRRGRLTISARGRALLWLLGFACSVATERRRIAKRSTRGARRVDVKTGAPPTLRQTVIVLGTQEAIRRLVSAILGPAPTSQLHDPEINREFRQAHKLHAGDRAALEGELERIYEQRQIRPWRSCLPVVARGGVVNTIIRFPLPFLSEPRTLADLLAGTKLVPRPSLWRRMRGRGGAT
jgi:hypothetical protein